MAGRCGTGADAVFCAGAADAVLSLADASTADDVRIGFFLKGTAEVDSNGSFFTITGPSEKIEDSIGVCMTLDVEGTEPSDDDIAVFRGHFDRGILMVVDPYASEFAVYLVDRDSVAVAQAVMTE